MIGEVFQNAIQVPCPAQQDPVSAKTMIENSIVHRKHKPVNSNLHCAGANFQMSTIKKRGGVCWRTLARHLSSLSTHVRTSKILKETDSLLKCRPFQRFNPMYNLANIFKILLTLNKV